VSAFSADVPFNVAVLVVSYSVFCDVEGLAEWAGLSIDRFNHSSRLDFLSDRSANLHSPQVLAFHEPVLGIGA